jgi:hypothetical protein
MNFNPQLMTAVERLGYRVTTADVATQTGIHLEEARAGLLELASRTGGHMQVTETGEVVYALPQDFRQVLVRKYIRLQLREWFDRVWKIVFYLIKISFGVLLISSIAVVYLTILAITLAALFGSEGGGDCGDCGGSCVLDIFNASGSSSSSSSRSSSSHKQLSRTTHSARVEKSSTPIRAKTNRKTLNFLEAVFSVLFGDGDPNADLEQRRWQYIGNLIHRQQGVAIGEQIAPYLDDVGRGYDREYENYMLPILTKFNGIPEVSPTGQIVYHFPDLQTTLKAAPGQFDRAPQVLKERRWKFSKATPTQRNWTFVLFGANLVGIVILALMLAGSMGGVMTILAAYGSGLIAIPAVRYFWVKYQDTQVRHRNSVRQQQAKLLQQKDLIQEKLDYAKQFAKQHQITARDIIYTTEEDALSQELKRLE